MGYSCVIFKSDNEPAIVKVLQESLKALRVEGLDRATRSRDVEDHCDSLEGWRLARGVVGNCYWVPHTDRPPGHDMAGGSRGGSYDVVGVGR